MSDAGFVAPSVADSYLASLNMGSTGNVIISPPPSSKIYEESILMDNILPNAIGAFVVFIMLLILLSTDLVSAHYSNATLINRTKLAAFLALFITSLIAFTFAIYRYFRKTGTKPNVSVVWIYGVLLGLLLILLLTTNVFKS